MIIQEFNVKVNENVFSEIISGNIYELRHGYSKNKKFTRLFENEVINVRIICSKTRQYIIKKFISAITEIADNKKIIKLKFQ